MTTDQKNPRHPDSLRVSFGTLSASGTDSLSSELMQSRCPLCSTDFPSVILEGTARRLMKCFSCGVAYLYPRPSERELSSFFSEEYISSEEEMEDRFGTRPEKGHRKVARFIHEQKARGRILDLGCAGGHFLDRHFRISAWEKWGVDLSKFAAARAKSKAIRVQVGDIHSVELPAAAFDIVTVLDTFYYFSEPQRELEAIRRILKPDGLLVIVLTCATSHIWRNTGWMGKLSGRAQASFLESHHVYFYNPKAITSVLRGSGFRVSSLQPLPATDQGSSPRNALASGYYAMSNVAWHLSGERLMLGPRFLVAALP
jgi:SAM-dependent methyltransferase